MEKLRNLSKKQKIVIISSLSCVLAIAIGISGFFIWKNRIVKAMQDTTMSSTDEIISETVGDTQTETTTETTTQSKKVPATAVTKEYKPKRTQTERTTRPSVGIKLNVPLVMQIPDYPTGCEAASATMLLKYHGFSVSLHEMINIIPREDLYMENGKVYGPSIYEKFVGNPRCTYTSETPGYGAFSPVITRALNNMIARKGGGYVAKNLTGCSFNILIDQLNSNRPVIVWATSKMRTPTQVNCWYIKNADGTETYFEYPRGTHVTVLTGYDENYVYMQDPYTGSCKYTHSAFIDKWNLLGKQAIVLYKNSSGTTTTTTTTVPVTTLPSTTEELTTLIETVTETTTTTTTETTESLDFTSTTNN